MNIKHIFCLLSLLLWVNAGWSQQKSKPQNKIVIIEGPIKIKEDSVRLSIYPFRYERFDPWIIKGIKQPVKNGYIRWEVTTKVPVALINGLFSSNMAYLAEPGDSICISHKNDQIVFSGKGSEKFRLGRMANSFLDTLKRSPEGLSDGNRKSASSLQDYLAWNSYLNRKTREWLNLLDKSKKNISQLAYLDLKDRVLRHIEKARMHKFHSIRRSSIIGTVNQYGLTNADLCKIYDTTIVNPSYHWLRFERNYVFTPDYCWDIIHDEDYRRRGKFFKTSESDTPILGKDPEDEFITVYNIIKKEHKGVVRENLLAYTFYSPGGILNEIGFTPKAEALLADYYTQSKHPDFKKRVKEYELERRAKWNLLNAPEFILTDTKGKAFKSKQLKGKIVIMDFWFTGCTGCVQMAPALRKVEKYFEKDSNIVFLGVSIDNDRNKWLTSIKEGKYTSGGGIQLYTGGEGSKHDIIRKLLVTGYPTLEIIDQSGLFVKYDKRKIDPRNEGGVKMIAFLQKQLSAMKDGPYVLHDKDSINAFSIENEKLKKKSFSRTSPSVLEVQTDEAKSFNVNLMPSLDVQLSVYPKPEKLFVLSDIEGNFDAFRKLLLKNKIVDKNLNWTFGNGHLVFGGDMFDRGRQVTECLWLIYSLEEKAKAAGGYVHFVLGNHEIMNLQGEHGYVEAKYKDNAALMGKTLTQLYNEDSELGRWLRTKNIVEKIGDVLFLHGGISSKINALTLTVAEINQLARPNYSTYKKDYGDEKTNNIMSTSLGPFWYRAYYDNKKDVPEIINNTLQKFDVKHIVTGHTIVADTISVHYGGKVINTDVHHAEGKSEALLIEGDKFYRVNTEGKKVLLFTDDKRKASGK